MNYSLLRCRHCESCVVCPAIALSHSAQPTAINITQTNTRPCPCMCSVLHPHMFACLCTLTPPCVHNELFGAVAAMANFFLPRYVLSVRSSAIAGWFYMAITGSLLTWNAPIAKQVLIRKDRSTRQGRKENSPQRLRATTSKREQRLAIRIRWTQSPWVVALRWDRVWSWTMC